MAQHAMTVDPGDSQPILVSVDLSKSAGSVLSSSVAEAVTWASHGPATMVKTLSRTPHNA